VYNRVYNFVRWNIYLLYMLFAAITLVDYLLLDFDTRLMGKHFSNLWTPLQDSYNHIYSVEFIED